MISREGLYELVWSVPMTRVGEKFKVSGSYMARVCVTLRVPRPERGYWAKLAVGKAPKKPSLPDAQPGDQLSWSQGEVIQALPRPQLEALPPRPLRGKLPRPVTGIHGLIRDTKGNYDTGYKVEEGQHLRPYKRLMVDVTASLAGLDKALAFANDLFNALESAGYRVLISSPSENFTRARIDEHEQLQKKQNGEHSYYDSRLWSPQRPTVVYVGSLAFGLAVVEMSENVEVRYVNRRYVRESDHKPPRASARYVRSELENHQGYSLWPAPVGCLRALS